MRPSGLQLRGPAGLALPYAGGEGAGRRLLFHGFDEAAREWRRITARESAVDVPARLVRTQVREREIGDRDRERERESER